ncbi:YihY/virulence factor BrkB family protein [Caldalkalibacillus thermarum TA2.A1]|uniref:YihY/virulence factor BrkB family protein n=2 Tax=Caldalkalibacillus thermarum (strain TA2.A1) TaxID=986075 RepID=A0A8X8I7K8_CALTT|nr:YihY/virulence factor BrkB family protein [Caldalkalibacillus thermarum]QZT35157.1 YihY/virulence factor BrkB family protein [Caldalkalibacillus thermarum TA2.A1]
MIPMWSFIKTLFERFMRHEIPDLAAQLSFYFLLSLFPFLLFAITLLAYLPLSTDYVLFMIGQYVPMESTDLVEENIRRVLDVQRPELLSFSLLFALWSASHGSYAIMRALNRAYDVEEERSFLRARVVAVLLILGMFVVFLVALILPVFGRALGLALFNVVGLSDEFLRMWHVIRWWISLFVIVLVFMYLYILAPNTTLRLREVWIGAVVAAMGWHLISLGFSYYVDNFANFTAMYGGIGGVVVFMLWLYLAGMMLLLGGEINSTLKLIRRSGS